MIEKWRKCLDAGGAFGASLNDLSKAFNCLPHELLIAKLHAYGVDVPSLKLLHSYLTKRMALTVRGLRFSSEIRKAPYLDHCYSTYSCATYSSFFPGVDIANYADDNTPHSSNINLKIRYYTI